jgi:HKD family nuclease
MYLLDCKDTKHWRMKLIHDKWLNMNEKVAYRKIVKIANKAHIQHLGKYLDIVKNKWLNKIREM